MVFDLKKAIAAIAAPLSVVGMIAGGIIYMNTNYAQAADVKQVLENQERQIRLYSQSQRNNMIFQLEYYDDRIRKLNEEKERASRNPKGNTRSVQDIQSDIDDTKKRRELVRESIIIEK